MVPMDDLLKAGARQLIAGDPYHIFRRIVKRKSPAAKIKPGGLRHRRAAEETLLGSADGILNRDDAISQAQMGVIVNGSIAAPVRLKHRLAAIGQ
jgi:hypothetical protein